MRVLVFNAGSTTLKWSVLDADTLTTFEAGSEQCRSAEPDALTELVRGVVRRTSAVDVVGHRIVHGGTRFVAATPVDPGVRSALEALVDLDPLHMRAALAGIDAVAVELPSVPQIVAFDTAFHAQMPPAAAGYGLPFEWSERWGLRRFGFHGLSVSYSIGRTPVLLGHLPRRVIVCHLGSGCSVTAVESGRSIDTTMGFTPLEGMMMATRAGSVDPGLLLYLQEHMGVGVHELRDTLERRSGLLGVSGVSSDLRRVLEAADSGNARARLACDQFVWTLHRAIGAMTGALGGADAIVFTGGIGENSERIRAEAAAALGLQLDEAANTGPKGDRIVSRPDSSIAALVVEAREDLVILDEVRRLQRAMTPAIGQ